MSYQILIENPIVTAAVAGVVAVALWKFTSGKAASPGVPKRLLTKNKKDVVYLFQLPFDKNGDNVSPFCLKLESYLRLMKIPFACPNGVWAQQAPKGKFPFIQLNDQVISDSTLIIKALEKNFGSLNANLTAEQQAVSVAVQRLCEEHLYMGLLYLKFLPDDAFELVKTNSLHSMPKLIKLFVAPMMRSAIRKSLWGHGMGRHTPEQVLQLLEDDFDALVAILGNKKYFLGDKLNLVDLIVYSEVYGFFKVESLPTSPIRNLVASRPTLVAFFERVHSEIESCPKAEWVDVQ